ncbi:hypothetical protein HK097_005258 [Rhizophlyctis rosea]|uniref:Uncharacterized protein n=1 Tax=Rhizophlyctis rosea TaxID=64517 RepID=A0AAD5SLG8_9FUNG|nr:hypothetical protein HK097_005258 [Rhizophlyctis rosea]
MSYAQKNGYHFQLIRHSIVNDRAGAWSKMLVAKDLLKSEKFDWVWIPIDDLEPNRISALVSFDCNGFNSGSLLLRADPWTLAYLDEAYEVGASTTPAHWNDQRGFAIAYNSKDEHRKHFGVLSQNKFNAYEIPCVGPDSTTWRHGDFVIHFAGFKGFKGDMTKEYVEKRIGVFEDGVDQLNWQWLDAKMVGAREIRRTGDKAFMA